jgi:hypothetical protein
LNKLNRVNDSLLISFFLNNFQLYTAIQSNVWNTLKMVDEITNLIIDEFVEHSVTNGIGSVSAEIVANTIVTLSSVNIRGKIIARLRKVSIYHYFFTYLFYFINYYYYF